MLKHSLPCETALLSEYLCWFHIEKVSCIFLPAYSNWWKIIFFWNIFKEENCMYVCMRACMCAYMCVCIWFDLISVSPISSRFWWNPDEWTCIYLLSCWPNVTCKCPVFHLYPLSCRLLTFQSKPKIVIRIQPMSLCSFVVNTSSQRDLKVGGEIKRNCWIVRIHFFSRSWGREPLRNCTSNFSTAFISANA